MPSVATEELNLLDNPLDMAEVIARENEWRFERLDEDELVVDVRGGWCTYRLIFIWQADVTALQFCCQADLIVEAGSQRRAMAELMATINTRTWLGHFHLSLEDNTPMFRYTLLVSGVGAVSVEQIEDMIDWGLLESDRYYPAFRSICQDGRAADEAMASAIVDVVGEA